MRNYDLTVFYDTSNGEDAAKELETKLETTITKNGGKIYNKEYLGKVSLAGTFKHHTQAYGTRFQYADNMFTYWIKNTQSMKASFNLLA